MTEAEERLVSACAGKQRFESREVAERVFRAWRARGTLKGAATAFRCAHCEGWHFGSTLRARPRKGA